MVGYSIYKKPLIILSILHFYISFGNKETPCSIMFVWIIFCTAGTCIAWDLPRKREHHLLNSKCVGNNWTLWHAHLLQCAKTVATVASSYRIHI